MNYTEEQQAIIDCKLPTGGIRKVIGYAGAAKTTTFVGYAKARPDHPILYAAFTKAVAEDAAQRFPSNVRCKTINAVAWAVEGKKYEKIGANVRFGAISHHFHINFFAAALVAKTLENWFNSDDPELTALHSIHDPDDIKQYNSITDKDRRMAFGQSLEEAAIQRAEHARAIWEIMLGGQNKFMPMTHSGYLKIYQLSKPQIDARVILLDECQDTNPVSMDLVLGQAQRYGTRVIMCGDPYQQIFAWRGGVDALQRVDCEALYLTQSFRFGNTIADVANIILEHYFAPEKLVRGFEMIQDALVQEFAPDEPHTIISRTNCAVFNSMVLCVARGVSFCYNGNLPELLNSLMDCYNLKMGWVERIQDKRIAAFQVWDRLKKMAEIDNELKGKMLIVEKHVARLPIIIQDIRALNTSPEFAQVIVTTTHKAKGLEWNNVMLDGDFVELFNEMGMPKPLLPPEGPAEGKKEEDYIDPAEINLLYVAATRAKRKLKLCNQLQRLVKWHCGIIEPPPRRTEDEEWSFRETEN